MSYSRKRKYARYPSCFGELDCLAIMNVAIKHGMEVITCRKPNMHCFNEVGLYGTSAQMRAVEAEWNSHGNTSKPPGFTAVFKVNLKRDRAEWLSVKVAAAKQRAISTKGGVKRCRIRGMRTVTLPLGYRKLRSRELPRKSDIAWDCTAGVFVPIDWADVERIGKRQFKEQAHLILRPPDVHRERRA